ncbi:amidohydrolase family protein [Arachidicoccus ginsenosidimutans]|uniref:amidohydrolase family protein n=1 Tax=Arachidicoccus sp. BS20 TaxID=1850526 RepID=UPI0009EE4DAF|nr:amidohydrolase family protein [Arachidicoccus sp. BS20]
MKRKLSVCTSIMLMLSILLTYGNFSVAQTFTNKVKRFISIDTPLFAITHVTLIDGTGKDIKQDQTIIVRNHIIENVGASSVVQIPTGVYIVDGTGKTLIPGLIMLHEHLFYPKIFDGNYSVGEMQFSAPRLYLAAGVTTIRTGGSIEPQTDLNIKDWINEGKEVGPNMDVTGPYIERAGLEIPELGFMKKPNEATQLVNYWADRGVTSFKLYNNVTREDVRQTVEAAHKRGLKVTAHLCSVTYAEASNPGIDNLEHSFRVASDFVPGKKEDVCNQAAVYQSLQKLREDDPKIQALIGLLIKNKTALTVTPNVFEPYTGRDTVPGGGMEALAPQFRKKIKMIYNTYLNRDSADAAMYKKDMHWVREFYDRGGLLLAGTDPTGVGRVVPGYANRHTVELLVESGFSLPEAIKICSLNGAQYLNIINKTGTIEKGKIADFTLINGDLEKNVKNIRNTEMVFKNGIGYDSKKLFESVKGMVGIE